MAVRVEEMLRAPWGVTHDSRLDLAAAPVRFCSQNVHPECSRCCSDILAAGVGVDQRKEILHRMDAWGEHAAVPAQFFRYRGAARIRANVYTLQQDYPRQPPIAAGVAIRPIRLHLDLS